MKNAGYEIIEMETTYEENGHLFGYVRGHNEKTNMWVTWCFKQSTRYPYEMDYFWGHYFDRERDAIIDFHERIIDDYRR